MFWPHCALCTQRRSAQVMMNFKIWLIAIGNLDIPWRTLSGRAYSVGHKSLPSILYIWRQRSLSHDCGSRPPSRPWQGRPCAKQESPQLTGDRLLQDTLTMSGRAALVMNFLDGASASEGIEGIELAEQGDSKNRHSVRVDANSVKHVMDAFLRTAADDKRLDLESDIPDETYENNFSKESCEDLPAEDSESKRTRHSSIASRIRIER
jgi:hypothetical protein